MKRGVHERIERYVQGHMTGDERMDFEQLLAGDESLRIMVEVEQQIVTTLHTDNNAVPLVASEPSARLLARLHSTPARLMTRQTPGMRNWFSLWSVRSWMAGIAGAVAVGIVAGIALWPVLHIPHERTVPAIQRDTIPVPTAPLSTEALETVAPSERSGIPAIQRPRPVADQKSRGSQRLKEAPRTSNTIDPVVSQPVRTQEQDEKDRLMLKELLRQSERTPVGIRRSDSVEMRVRVEKE